MKMNLKKLVSLLVAVMMFVTCAPVAFAGVDYSVEDAYEECAVLYPEFVAKVKAQGISDEQIIALLYSIQEYLLALPIEITEENFEEYFMDAVYEAVSLRNHRDIRNALVAAYPDAVVDGTEGVIHEDFEPIMETIKAIIFGNGLLDKGDEEETTEPTQTETDAPTEGTTAPTENATEAPTENTTEAPTEEATEKETVKVENGATGGGGTGGGGVAVEEPTEAPTEKETEKETEKATEKEETKKPGFKDMNQAAWAEEAVNALVDMGIISGYPDGTFLPNKSITRAEFAKIIVLASGRYNKDAKCSFADVPENQWYYSYVASAFELGFITGRSETVFDPNSNITRADLCTVVYRFIKSINPEFKATAAANFADGDKIPSYAVEAVNALYSAKIVGGMGDNRFEPLSPATRAQSAKIIYGAINAALGL